MVIVEVDGFREEFELQEKFQNPRMLYITEYQGSRGIDIPNWDKRTVAEKAVLALAYQLLRQSGCDGFYEREFRPQQW